MPNGLEILGGTMRQVGGDLGSFADRQRQYEEMVQRRVAVLQEQKRQEEMQRMQAAEESRRAAEFEQKKHAAELQQQEADRQQKAMADFRKYQQGEQKAKPQAPPQPYLAPGLGPQGEAMHQPPQEFETVRPTRDQMQSKAMELGVYGDPGVKAYMDDTAPAKAEPEVWETIKTDKGYAQVNKQTGVVRDLGVKPGIEPNNNPKWQVLQTDKGIFQVNPETGETRDTGLQPPPQLSPKSVENVKGKKLILNVAKKQLMNVRKKFEAIQNSLSAGPGGQGRAPTPSGQAFDAAVDGLRNSIRSLTRTPGEGSMSDYEGKLAQLANPDRTRFESVTMQQIEQLEDLINTLDTGYGEMSADMDAPKTRATTGARDFGKEYGF